jgi:23S rRNA (cytosine1962-C5)-methyltransferase
MAAHPLPYPIIRLKKGKEKSLLQMHPWVFSGAIAHEPAQLQNGDLVQVQSADGHYLATGHFNRSTISVRCIDFEGHTIDRTFLRKKLSDCILLRKTLGLPSAATNCYRLMHGEGDGMPGMIADVYGNTVVLQCFTEGMLQLQVMLAEIILEEMPEIGGVYSKSAETMAKHGVAAVADDFLIKRNDYTPAETVLENDMRFHIDFMKGQKTGFFLDQRDNRQLLEHYSGGKTVLNTFCYTGGFSVAAIRGGATQVSSVDSSARAIADLHRNIALVENASEKHDPQTKDVMAFLRNIQQDYDVIVLDPPAYAKHLNQSAKAMIGYRNLNTEGLRRLKKGGILFTFSCSQAIDKQLFRKIVFQAALQAGRNIRVLHQLSQPPDHPVSIYHPEGEYLKGLVLYVD